MFGRKETYPPVCAVIVAAGESRRMGGENKLLLPLCGMPVLAHTLLAFERCDAIRDIILVSREQDLLLYGKLARENGVSKLRAVVRGGDTRTASVLAGLTASSEDAELIAVHDGVRPLVSDTIITETVRAAAEADAAAPVVPVKDSIKRLSHGCIAADVPRDTLGAVQTPQIFRRALLKRALFAAERENRSFTDECAAVERLGTAVRVTSGDYSNIKITTPEDMLIAEALLQGRDKL